MPFSGQPIRYGRLRLFITLLDVLAVINGIGTIIAVLVWGMASARTGPPRDGGEALAIFIILMVILLAVGSGIVIYVTLRGQADLLRLAIDIEWNTRSVAMHVNPGNQPAPTP